MKNNQHNPFMPFKGTVNTQDNLRQLINLRKDTVTSYGFFAPDSLYPVYICPKCQSMEVSLSVLKPDTENLNSFDSYIKYLSSLTNSLPLASCRKCKDSSFPPAWTGFFTYIAEAACDLFIHIEEGTVKRAFKLHLLGDPEPIKRLSTDEDFLIAFKFPFSYRWAWQQLIDRFAGKDIFQVQKIHDGYYIAIDGAGKTNDQKWQGWFAETSKGDTLDSVVLISNKTCDASLDGGPGYWLEKEDLLLIEEGKMRLFIFYSSTKYIKSLRSTLLQRGISLSGTVDPLTISIDNYYCEIPGYSLLNTAALTGSPNLSMLRRHLISRIELLEAIRGTGNRLSNIFEENYLISIKDGNTLEVKDPENNKLLRSVFLIEYSEMSTLPKSDFLTFISEELGYDPSTDTFNTGN